MPNTSIVDSFRQYFYMTNTDTPERNIKKTAYGIRYQVYCREFGFEKEEDCPGQEEKDEYDDQSMHCLLIHKPSNTAAGCSRLILPCHQGEITSLPLERHCAQALEPERFDMSSLAPGTYGEFSRLAVLSRFRRRASDEHKPFSLTEEDMLAARGRESFPFIPVSLFLATLVLFLQSDLDYAFAVMEPKLARLLRRFGIIFTQVGRVIDYHGPRAPFVLHKDEVLTDLQPEVYELMVLIDKMMSRDAHNT